jgi:hypothetical protein
MVDGQSVDKLRQLTPWDVATCDILASLRVASCAQLDERGTAHIVATERTARKQLEDAGGDGAERVALIIQHRGGWRGLRCADHQCPWVVKWGQGGAHSHGPHSDVNAARPSVSPACEPGCGQVAPSCAITRSNLRQSCAMGMSQVGVAPSGRDLEREHRSVARDPRCVRCWAACRVGCSGGCWSVRYCGRSWRRPSP